MYNLLFLILLVGSGLFAYTALIKRRYVGLAIGIAGIVLTIALFGGMTLWGEYLWFEALGFEQRFMAEFGYRLVVTLLCTLIPAILAWNLTWTIQKQGKIGYLAVTIIIGVWGGLVGFSNWEIVVKFINSVLIGTRDPILNKDIGFYLFHLPFYDLFYTLLFTTFLLTFVAVFTTEFARFKKGGSIETQLTSGSPVPARSKWAIYLNAALLLAALSLGKVLSRYHLLYSESGAVHGAGWADVNIKLPLYLVVIAITLIGAVFLVVPGLRDFPRRLFYKSEQTEKQRIFLNLVSIGGTIAVTWLIALTVIPSVYQGLRVEPNEITFERPYIKNNIAFTRKAFKLDTVEEREFPASETFTRQTVADNQNTFSNIRLWDWRALDSVYDQFQEIRLYYEFVDVDIDRYTINNRRRQVMVSAREMELPNLPEGSRTFVNRRFKYTHGYGITLTTVNDFTEQGLPNLLIKDIPPKSAYQELNVSQPRIYYGERTNTYAVVNSTEKEFDYPKGDANVYFSYDGQGGVEISNFWRKFLFGWKMGGTRFLFSGYPKEESRIMFHRNIIDRVKTLAPFLMFDNDPYIVLSKGKLYWIIDAYTTSMDYPYSEPHDFQSAFDYTGKERPGLPGNIYQKINYIRNSVKVVVDAYQGSVNFYVFEEEDPIIRVWQSIFPELFKNRSEMDDELMKHIRYPTDMLLTQGKVYAKYHMTDPAVFYNQEDLWVQATEKYYDGIQSVRPYYVMWETPGTDNLEYVLILPFTPKNRQVLIGWIAGMCDPGNYGRFIAYKFPKEKRIIGPQQVETKIDQDSHLSGQLTLWDQRGSNVIRGNVLAIPIDETIIYVEPIYLQAETAAYPELRLVAVMHGDDLSYAEDFETALEGLFKEQQPELVKSTPGTTLQTLIERASNAFDQYLEQSGEKNFQSAARSLEQLKQTLQELEQRTSSK